MRTKTTMYSIGDRVKVPAGVQHNTMTAGKSGVIVEIGTPALGIKFDGMPKVHKWYVDKEVKLVKKTSSVM